LKFLYNSLVKFLALGSGSGALFLCVALSIYFLTRDLEEKRTIFEVATSTILLPATSTMSWVNNIKLLSEANERLLRENTRLKLLHDQMVQQSKENDRLREYLNFKKEQDFSLRLGQIISRDPGRLSATFMINIGSADSIKTNMPVVTPRGLVGKTVKVFQNQSLVQILTDPLMKVSVLENRTRTVGTLESVDSYTSFVVFPGHAEVRTGDTIVTSGYGGVFPKGIMVGTIEETRPGELEVLKNAKIILTQNPYYLEEVFVIIREAEWHNRGGL
jgi:rod shape-determining protein MreC